MKWEKERVKEGSVAVRSIDRRGVCRLASVLLVSTYVLSRETPFPLAALEVKEPHVKVFKVFEVIPWAASGLWRIFQILEGTFPICVGKFARQ